MRHFLQRLLGIFDPPAARHYRRVRRLKRSKNSEDRQKYVIFLPFRLNSDATWVELILAISYRLRGFTPIVLFGDRLCPIVDGDLSNKPKFPKAVIDRLRLRRYVNSFGLQPTHFGSLLTTTQKKQIRQEAYAAPIHCIATYRKYEVDLGRSVQASLCRYFLRGTPSLQENELITRKFFHTALLSLEAARVIHHRYKPSLLISSHGIYSTWGVFCDYFQAKDLPYISWGFQYKKNAFIFSHNKSYHEDIIKENPEDWLGQPVSKQKLAEAVDYLRSKGSASHSDAINYYSYSKEGADAELFDLTTGYQYKLGVFPNISWDAQISFKPKTFESMNDWLITTVEWAAENPEVIVIIRAHPAEKRAGYEVKETARKLITDAFRSPPENVVILDKADDPSSYRVLSAVDACAVYGSKFGLEAAVEGKAVVVGGEAYYSGKGITFDARGRDNYKDLLSQVTLSNLKPSTKMVEMSKLYAYHYHSRRQTVLKLAELDRTSFRSFLFDDETQLVNGQIPALNKFIEASLSGEPFWDIS